MNAFRENLPIAALIFLLVGLSFSLACRLTSSPAYSSLETPTVWSRFLGSATALLSNDLYEVADRYYHKGVPHATEKDFDDPFQRLGEVVAPTHHQHLSGSRELMEIMPWLSLATKVDPGNIEAYQVAVYWLKSADKFDQARAVVRKALAANPGDYRLYVELALIAAETEDRELSAENFDLAFKLWPEPLDADDEEARLDMGRMLTYRSLLYLLAGENTAAIELLKKARVWLPERESLSNEIARLERGEVDREALEARWRLITREQHQFDCQRDHDEHGH